MDPWPKFPESAEEAKEKLRIAINKLHERVDEQDDLRATDAPASEDLRAAIAKGMFRQNFFGPWEENEEVRQQLFHEVLHLKPATQ
jgi:hypothetical protein